MVGIFEKLGGPSQLDYRLTSWGAVHPKIPHLFIIHHSLLSFIYIRGRTGFDGGSEAG